ncbi:NaMN:DMB phosphoribosyltransferase [Archaeoglobus sulfaticallidus PM70-1]|uniref:UPF0284 protein Asulf_02285 n=1 Tax=Archaeoglobus sulfaticallidus PM70-1 TaxID=387631 RepID=N0BIS5_9EURY|nr:TIGR00303 family protein [Archaeoglobus sulfaticallidus]AGK62237.1 NaMN:DMB phosphoribosyltransferase [Archaeoglobus sulfaticallidus PM70-1]
MSDLMLVVLGNTEVATIPGISVAGASPELTKFTPPADIEYVLCGKPLIIDAIPVTPEGHPTPAIITKACYELADFPIVAVRGGSILSPKVPFVQITDEHGRDFRRESAVPNVEEIVKNARMFGQELRKFVDELVIGESTPGGTTTAQAVLWALGYRAKTSSASPSNPHQLKEEVIKEGFRRIDADIGCFADEPYKALQEFGDPMLATVAGICLGFDKSVVLAGGSQMLAVSAFLKAAGENLSRFRIATTKYVVNDSSSTFRETAEEIGIEFWTAMLDFSSSAYKGLQDYERGYVKEGVGAGGAVYLAAKNGFSEDDVARKVDELYALLKKGES